MPRFHFHITDSAGLVRDEQGSELPGLDAAIAEAKKIARDLAMESLLSRLPVGDRAIIIANDDGRRLYQVFLRNVIT